MRIVITDLDGTLLDHNSYSFEAAKPALAELKRQAVPIIFCTSKTRNETVHWRDVLGIGDPFIVENGGAICIPDSYFGESNARTVVLGAPYEELARSLAEASRLSQCRVRGFAGMTVEEVATECGLDQADAALAKQREYDEPFLILDADRREELLEAIRHLGYRVTQGGRFFHITGNHDKANAVRELVGMYGRGGNHVDSLGLGDGLNDAAFLNAVGRAILIRSPHLAELQHLVPGGHPTEVEGPRGWNDAVLRWLEMVV